MDLIERLIDEADGYGDGPVVVHDIEGIRALLREAAAEIERLRAEREVIGAEVVKYAEKSGRLEAKVGRLAETLQKLAAHVRPTCSALWDEAQAALRGHDQEDEK